MKKLVALFYEDSSAGKQVITDLILGGINQEDIYYISRSLDCKQNIPTSENIRQTSINCQTNKSLLPASVLKGAVSGGIIGFMLYIVLLFMIPGLHHLMLAESLPIILAIGITGIAIGVTVGSILSITRVKEEKNCCMTVVYAEPFKENFVREVFNKYNAANIKVFCETRD